MSVGRELVDIVAGALFVLAVAVAWGAGWVTGVACAPRVWTWVFGG